MKAVSVYRMLEQKCFEYYTNISFMCSYHPESVYQFNRLYIGGNLNWLSPVKYIILDLKKTLVASFMQCYRSKTALFECL